MSGERQGYGGTETHDHHLLFIASDGAPAGYMARYSRCPRFLAQDEQWLYYRRQVAAEFPRATLLAVIDDLDHVHPQVVVAPGLALNAGLDAHMS